jgi:hypothetical protein
MILQTEVLHCAIRLLPKDANVALLSQNTSLYLWSMKMDGPWSLTQYSPTGGPSLGCRDEWRRIWARIQEMDFRFCYEVE